MKWPTLPLRPQIALEALLTSAASCAAGIYFSRIGRPWWWTGLVSASVAVPATLLLVFWALRGRWVALRAASDVLLSFSERDYGLQIKVSSCDEIGQLLSQLNSLGERLRSQHDEIYQRELLLETVLQHTPTAIALSNEEGHIVYANTVARKALNQDRPLEGLGLGPLLAAGPPALNAAVEDGRDRLFSLESDAGPETFHVAVRSLRLNAQPHQLLMIRRLTAELSRQEVAVWKKVIRTISHELNNSLAPISSLVHTARLITNSSDHLDRLTTIFDTIEERAAHLRDFLAGYARFARLPPPKVEPVHWESFLRQLSQLCPFQRIGSAPLRQGHFDATQLQQVLINLLKNAAEAGSPVNDTSLEVVDEGPQGFRIVISDRGKGMNDEVLRNALLPFYSTKHSGSGLGLPLCREILEAHGGKLQITRRDGGGISVTCTIPASGPRHRG